LPPRPWTRSRSRSPTGRSPSSWAARPASEVSRSGITAAAAVAAYLVNSLAPLVDLLDPVQKLSPFYHYAAQNPLRDGLDPLHLLVLLAIAAVAAAGSVLVFRLRDLS